MVHALQEIRRVLVARGTLIDLRPLADNWPVEISSRRETQRAGRVSDLPQGLEDDAAANLAFSQAEASGWFRREEEGSFSLFDYWDSPNDMQEYIDDEEVDFIGIEDDTWKRIRSLWAIADADARVRLRVRMLITRWRKTD